MIHIYKIFFLSLAGGWWGNVDATWRPWYRIFLNIGIESQMKRYSIPNLTFRPQTALIHYMRYNFPFLFFAKNNVQLTGNENNGQPLKPSHDQWDCHHIESTCRVFSLLSYGQSTAILHAEKDPHLWCASQSVSSHTLLYWCLRHQKHINFLDQKTHASIKAYLFYFMQAPPTTLQS